MIYRRGKSNNKQIEAESSFHFFDRDDYQMMLPSVYAESIHLFYLLRLVLSLLKETEEDVKKCTQQSLKFHLVTFVPVSTIQGTSGT